MTSAARVRRRRRPGLSKLQQGWIDPPRDKPWAKLFVDLITGDAWRGLSVNARRALDALIAQHFRYRQTDNGSLQISYRQFEKAGVTRRMIAPAIRELKSVGLIETRQGTPRNGLMRRPLLYRLLMYEPAGIIPDAHRSFVFVPLEAMESSEWCRLSINARRVMDRLLVENQRHNRMANGELRVSFDQFVKDGVGRRLVKNALDELVAAGFLIVTCGKRRGSRRPPNIYRITILGTIDGPPIWRPREPEELSTPREKDTKIMPRKKIPTPRRCTGTTPRKCTGNGHFPHPEGAPVKPAAIPPEGALSIIYRVGGGDGVSVPAAASAQSATPCVENRRSAREKSQAARKRTKSAAKIDRAERVEAYAMARCRWIARFGLPAHDEDNLLRACYSIGDTSADEWAMLACSRFPRRWARWERGGAVVEACAAPLPTVPREPPPRRERGH
jgi:hypothetical protein